MAFGGAHLNSSVIMRRMTDQGSWIASFPRNSLFTLSHFSHPLVVPHGLPWPGIPRIWSINYKNEADAAHWFERENMNQYGRVTGLIELLKGNEAFFNAADCDEDHRAVARRAIIFQVDRALFSQESAERFQDQLREEAREEEERGTEMPDLD